MSDNPGKIVGLIEVDTSTGAVKFKDASSLEAKDRLLKKLEIAAAYFSKCDYCLIDGLSLKEILLEAKRQIESAPPPVG